MAKERNDHAGSGIDKAHPKTLTEKIGDGFKKIVAEKPAPKQEPQAAPTIIPPGD